MTKYLYKANTGEDLPRCVGQNNQETIHVKGSFQSTIPTFNKKRHNIEKSWLETKESRSSYKADEEEEPEDQQ